MADFSVEGKYNDKLRKLEPTDLAHADTFNPLFKQLIDNDAYLKDEVEKSNQIVEKNYKQDRAIAGLASSLEASKRVIGGKYFYDNFTSRYNIEPDLTQTTLIEDLDSTTETTIVMVDHGLETGDLIINETRNGARRMVTKKNDSVLTLNAVNGQKIGDLIKKYKKDREVFAGEITTETVIEIENHDLSVGDYIVNVTRGNQVRTISSVMDVNTVVVSTVTGQIPTDTIHIFKYLGEDNTEGARVLTGKIDEVKNGEFKVGQEITIQDDIYMEDVVVTKAELDDVVGVNEVVDATVVNSAYTTSANARPVMLDNGWIVSVVKDNFTARFYVSKDNFTTEPTQLCFVVGDFNNGSLVGKGNMIYFIYESGTAVKLIKFDATTVDNIDLISTAQTIDSQTTTSSVSLAISPDKSTLWATWSSKNATYPNSFNIRACKGDIQEDGSVVWGSVKQVTEISLSGVNYDNPTITITLDNKPTIVFIGDEGSNNRRYVKYTVGNGNNGWSSVKNLYDAGGNYAQSNPQVVTDKNGALLCVWHGFDSTNSTVENIRFSKSPDGGLTWSAMEKLTNYTITTQRAMFPSITVDKNNKIYVLYFNSKSAFGIGKLTNENGVWSDDGIVISGAKYNISTLYDNSFSLDFSEPIFIFNDNDGSAVKFYGKWNSIKQTFYLETTEIKNKFKKGSLIGRTTAKYDETGIGFGNIQGETFVIEEV